MVLSKQFGKIYGLDKSAVQVLAAVVSKTMARSGLVESDNKDPNSSVQSRADAQGDFDDHQDDEYSSYTVTSASDGERDLDEDEAGEEEQESEYVDEDAEAERDHDYYLMERLNKANRDNNSKGVVRDNSLLSQLF
jgi:hypothetical protein